jgi:hypothetical protein
MSRPVGPGKPPVESRFGKGQSGNPKGRPKNPKPPAASAFDIVIDRTLTVTQGGRPREVTVEEALQHRTYQDAIAGNRAARREVLKMIAKREQYLAARLDDTKPIVECRREYDSDNANAAFVILGIAREGGRFGEFVLESWAVQLALSRRSGGRRLTEQEMAEIRRRTRDADTLRWPRSSGK